MTEYEMKLQEEFDRMMLEISSESLIKFRDKCISNGLVVSRICMPWAGMTGFEVKLKEQ